MSSITHPDLFILNQLLVLEQKIREAPTLEVLGFLLVNEVYRLVPYRQAVFWQWDGTTPRLLALSGLAVPDPRTPYALWLVHLLHVLGLSSATTELRGITAMNLPEVERLEWGEWLPSHALLFPITPPSGPPVGLLLLARDSPFEEPVMALLKRLSSTFGHALAALHRKPRWLTGWPSIRKRGILRFWLGVGLLLALFLLPVRQSVLVPAEVKSMEPAIVRSPLDGVVQEFAVVPNALVKQGQLLLTLDPTTLNTRLEVARKELELATAEYRQSAQQAVFDQKSKARLTLLQGHMAQHATEVTYTASLLERGQIRAPQDGVAVFEDVNQWLGRPVVIGERILEIANPTRVELALSLAVTNAIPLEPGAKGLVFFNNDPQHPLSITLRQVGYYASVTAEGVLSYALRADLEIHDVPPRIGLRGVAKVYGAPTTLFYYLLHRPLAMLRLWLG